MQRIYKFIIMMAVLLTLTACQGASEQKKGALSLEAKSEMHRPQEEDSEDTDTIYVYVCGAVICEGVYELPKESRVYEAILAAGGFREDAAKSQVNQAKVLEDEEQIYVPTLEEVMNGLSLEPGKININQASKEELMTLPGVGASRAESIIAYREQHGKFQSIEDIMQISGIKEALFEKIKELITI